MVTLVAPAAYNCFTNSQEKTIELCPDAKRVFRYVPKDEMDVILREVTTLPPLSKEDEMSLKQFKFDQTIFRDPNWDLQVMRLFFNGEMTVDEYATLMVFSGIETERRFIPNQTATPLAPLSATEIGTIANPHERDLAWDDFLTASQELYSSPAEQEKIKKFIALQQAKSHPDPIFMMVSGENAYLNLPMPQGKKGYYIYSPAALKSFMEVMAEGVDPQSDFKETYFRSIGIDYVHCLAEPHDFERIDVRPVFIPNRWVKNPPKVHQYDTTSHGVFIYGHDALVHILGMQCYTPLSHAHIWREMAMALKRDHFELYNTLLDFALVYKREVIEAQFGPEFAQPFPDGPFIFKANFLEVLIPRIQQEQNDPDFDGTPIIEVFKRLPESLLSLAGLTSTSLDGLNV